jgi:hypothetical protein
MFNSYISSIINEKAKHSKRLRVLLFQPPRIRNWGMAARSDHIAESCSPAVHPLGPTGHPTAAATSHPTPHHTDYTPEMQKLSMWKFSYTYGMKCLKQKYVIKYVQHTAALQSNYLPRSLGTVSQNQF